MFARLLIWARFWDVFDVYTSEMFGAVFLNKHWISQLQDELSRLTFTSGRVNFVVFGGLFVCRGAVCLSVSVGVGPWIKRLWSTAAFGLIIKRFTCLDVTPGTKFRTVWLPEGQTLVVKHLQCVFFFFFFLNIFVQKTKDDYSKNKYELRCMYLTMNLE